MSKIDDGGPAFPQNDATTNRINNLDGMSLRDWFAGQASEADIQHWFDAFYRQGIIRTREECRYAYADAMLAARKGGGA